MNDTQEKVEETQNQEENILVDIEENETKQEEPSKIEAKEEERTDVRSDEQEEELENYSENVQKRINQLTAKRNLTMVTLQSLVAELKPKQLVLKNFIRRLLMLVTLKRCLKRVTSWLNSLLKMRGLESKNSEQSKATQLKQMRDKVKKSSPKRGRPKKNKS